MMPLRKPVSRNDLHLRNFSLADPLFLLFFFLLFFVVVAVVVATFFVRQFTLLVWQSVGKIGGGVSVCTRLHCKRTPVAPELPPSSSSSSCTFCCLSRASRKKTSLRRDSDARDDKGADTPSLFLRECRWTAAYNGVWVSVCVCVCRARANKKLTKQCEKRDTEMQFITHTESRLINYDTRCFVAAKWQNKKIRWHYLARLFQDKKKREWRI